MIRALAIAVVMLPAGLAATPANAQDAGTVAPPIATDPPPPPADQPPADPAPPPPPAAPADLVTPQPADTTQSPPSPGSDSAPSDPTPPAGSGTSEDTRTRQPAHQSSDQPAPAPTPLSGTAAAPTAGAMPAAAPEDSGSSTGYPDAWLGQDTFVVGKTPAKERGSAPMLRRPFGGLFALAVSTRATRMEAKARRSHQTAQASALGGRPPRPGIPLPDQNPFFNLLSGPGGAAAGLGLVSMLAVLGAALVLPHDRLKRFRTPTVSWSPLAYVPPIELPG